MTGEGKYLFSKSLLPKGSTNMFASEGAWRGFIRKKKKERELLRYIERGRERERERAREREEERGSERG